MSDSWTSPIRVPASPGRRAVHHWSYPLTSSGSGRTSRAAVEPGAVAAQPPAPGHRTRRCARPRGATDGRPPPGQEHRVHRPACGNRPAPQPRPWSGTEQQSSPRPPRQPRHATRGQVGRGRAHATPAAASPEPHREVGRQVKSWPLVTGRRGLVGAWASASSGSPRSALPRRADHLWIPEGATVARADVTALPHTVLSCHGFHGWKQYSPRPTHDRDQVPGQPVRVQEALGARATTAQWSAAVMRQEARATPRHAACSSIAARKTHPGHALSARAPRR